MKKVASTFFMCLTFLVYASAQYNKVFYNATMSTGSPTGELPVDIVDAGNGNTCVLARNWGIISLKELDFSGNVICSETFSVNTANLAFGSEKLLRTPNGDYLVAGRYYQGTILNPFVARFQKDPGNPAKFICTWFYLYPSNNTGNMGLGRRYSELNIVKAEDDPSESYIIATDGDATNTPVVGSISIVNAFKISANGTLLWNKKYYDNSGSVTDAYVHALCYGHVSEAATTKKYLIAGAADKGDRTFFLTIDGNGNIVNQYREYNMPGDEYLHDATYDVATSEFILTNTTNSPLRNSLSQVAINKISFIGMGFTQTDFYFENDLASTNCFSSAGRIREDATNTYYLVGGYASRDFNGTGIEHAGPTILKIDKSSNVQFYKRYNRLGLGAGTGIASVVDPGGTENYAVCASVAVGPSDNSRVFTTNTSGITCGEEDLIYDQSNALFTPTDYILSQASMSGRMLNIPTAGGSFQERNCDPTNPEYRLATSLYTESNESIKVYPSILSSNDRTVILDLSISKISNLTVILRGIDGREISRQHYKVNPSDSRLKFDCGIEVPGTYILTIESNNPELRHRTKISKL